VMQDLRIDLRCRNNILYHAIFDTHRSVRDFCLTRGHYRLYGDIGGWLRLTESPWKKDGEIRKGAQHVADSLRMLPEDLYPVALYAIQSPTVTLEVEAATFLPLAAASRAALPSTTSPYRDSLAAALGGLSAREQKVIEMRFGMNGYYEHSLEDVGREFAVTRERVRQIENRALRRLRMPSSSEALRRDMKPTGVIDTG
jgi:hypothetical protein